MGWAPTSTRKQTPPELPGLNHQPKSTHPAAYVAEHGLVGHQMEEEALGPVKALCSSVGECQGQEVEVGGLLNSRSREGIAGFQRGNQYILKCK